MELAQQRGHVAEQFFQARKRNLADLAVFQCHGFAQVVPGADGIHAQQFAGHLETGDLLAAIGIALEGLEMAQTDGVEHVELVVEAVQALIALDLAAAVDDLFQPLHVTLVQPHWQAQLVHAAGRAAGAQGVQGERRWRLNGRVGR